MNSLIKFINSHDGCRAYGMLNGKLVVSSLCSVGGIAITVSDSIEPTMQAARDWLGY